MGEVHALRIKSPYKLLHVEDIKITNKPSEHGTLYLKCLVDDSINFKYSIEASTKDEITVYEENESENNSDVDVNKVNEGKSTVLFNGLIKDIKTTSDNGIYYVEINALSKTCELDIKEKSRSFQNINMTYDELITSVLKDYGYNNFVQSVGCGKKIAKPIFQYKETDWNFLKRICSELNSQVYCDIINKNNLLYFGMNNGKSYNISEYIPYKACKDLKAFYKAGGYEEGFDDTDYFYYEIKSRERYETGDKLYFKQKDVYVTEYETCKYQDEIIYKYRLCRKNGVWQTKLYNSLISGASLEGKVLATQGEEVKLKLDIDKEQSENEAAWFKYAPPTGNTMYSMPIVGTSARLYFPDESGKEPLISGCVRTNGSSCAKTSDTSKRYFGTEHGSEVEMTPSALNIKGGSASPISISIDDATGITITSPKKLTLSADSEIVMKTPKSVKINGVSQINAVKTGTESGFSLEGDLHFLSDNVKKEGSSSESYPDFDDEPQAGVMPEPEPEPEESGFNWGKLACNVLAGLAVVAAVTAAAVFVVATAGAGVAVIGAVAAGAAIGGTAAVASMAVSDIQRGEVSDIGEYMGAAARESFIGAVSGAVFGPFGATESLGGKMTLGATTNAFESIIRQKLEGKDINWGTVAQDALIGAGTAGVFHYGGKAATKASPYVKKAYNKVSAKASENARYAKTAFSNWQKNYFSSKHITMGTELGTIDDGIRAYISEFKKVKKDFPSVNDVINNSKKMPGGKKFEDWFDFLTCDEVDKLWNTSNKMVARDARNALRAGNNHEWYKVSQANVAKRWGLTAKEIKYDAVTNVNGVHDPDLWFRDIKVPENTKKSNPTLKNKNTISGRHSDGKRIKPNNVKRNTYTANDGKIKEYSTHKREENSASSLAHKELDNMFDSCKSKGEYLEKLNEWADKHLMQTEKDNADNIISRGRDALPECMRLPKK